MRCLPFIGFALCFAFQLPAEEARSTAPALTFTKQEPAPGSIASSSTPEILLHFSEGQTLPAKETFLMEVDRVDVTALAQLADGVMKYQPATPLSIGGHDVRITGTLPGGIAFQEISWTFQTPEAKSTSNWTTGLVPSGTWEYGIRQNAANPDRSRLNSNIAFNTQGIGPVQTTIVSNFQGQDTPDQRGENFDVSNFSTILTMPSGTTVGLGDVQANFDSLVVSNLTRRGFTFQQKLPFLNSGVDVFLVRSESIFGFQHGFGVADPNQRIDGVSYFFSPFKNAEKLTLRALYMRGENAAEQGFNFGGVTRGSKGNAYGAAMSSVLFSGQLRSELFASWSDFDFNAADGFNGNRDQAVLARVFFLPAPRTIRNHPSAFQLQLELQDLGTFFKTLANPFLVSDRLGFNINSSWNWGVFGLTGGASRFHDNVNSIAILPTVNNLAYSGGFSLTPQSTTGPPKLPSLNFTTSRSEQESINAVAAFLAVHNVVNTYASVIALNRAFCNLSLNLSYTINQDLNDRQPDTDSKNATLTAMLIPMPSWNFGPSIGFTHIRNRNSQVDTDLWTYSLTTGFPVVPQVMNLDGQISYSSTNTSDLINQSSNLSGTAQLSFLWGQLLKAPGKQAISMRISYNRNIVEAPIILRQKGLEIFATLELSYPFQ